MSIESLQSLLVDPEQAGAFYLTAADLGPLGEATLELGFQRIVLDLAGCASKQELMRRLATAFAFPPYSGNNWDALADNLGDLQWLPADGYVLGVEHPQALRLAEPDSYATFVSVLEEASLQWRDQGVPFWAFIALPANEFDALQA